MALVTGYHPIIANTSVASNTPFLGSGGSGGSGGGGGGGGADWFRIRPPPDYDYREPQMLRRRYVRVLVVDPNENIPLDQCVLYAGEEKLTDLNDQELFFELDIKSLLAAHNGRRATIIDKKVKERTEFLEPAKIRDLKMVVVTVAEF